MGVLFCLAIGLLCTFVLCLYFVFCSLTFALFLCALCFVKCKKDSSTFFQNNGLYLENSDQVIRWVGAVFIEDANH